MDEQQQRRVNEAGEQFANALVDSYKTVADRGASVQEMNTQLSQQFFNTAIESLQRTTQETRGATQELAEQTQRGQEATRFLAQESVGAYMDFLNSMFSFSQAAPQAAERGDRGDAEGSTTGEADNGESLREQLRNTVRESVRRSEQGL